MHRKLMRLLTTSQLASVMVTLHVSVGLPVHAFRSPLSFDNTATTLIVVSKARLGSLGLAGAVKCNTTTRPIHLDSHACQQPGCP
jgi:hypothetical protein